MKRAVAFCLIVVLYSGCRAPVPSFNLLAPYGGTRVPPPATSSYATPGNYYPQQPGAQPLSPTPAPSLQRAPASGLLSPPNNQGSTRPPPSEAELLLTGKANPNSQSKFVWRPSRGRIYTASQIDAENGGDAFGKNVVQLAAFQENTPQARASGNISPAAAIRTFAGDEKPIEIIEPEKQSDEIEYPPPRLAPMPVNDFSKSAVPANRRAAGDSTRVSTLPNSRTGLPRGLTFRGQETDAPESDGKESDQIETASKQDKARWKAR